MVAATIQLAILSFMLLRYLVRQSLFQLWLTIVLLSTSMLKTIKVIIKISRNYLSYFTIRITRFYCNLILMHLTYYFIGNTPMHIAAMYNHSSCIEALLKHQSEAIDMQNFSGASPLQVSLSLYDLLWQVSKVMLFYCTFV